MKKISLNAIFTFIFSIMLIFSLLVIFKVNALTKELNIEGVEIVEKSTGVTGDISSSNADEINDTITFHKLNDYVIYKIKITNNLESNIIIKDITDDNTNDYVTYEYDKHQDEELESGKSIDLLIKVKYINELTDLTKRDQISSVKLSINYEENGKTNTKEIKLNPGTNDDIKFHLVLFIASSAGLIICTINRKTNKNSIKKITTIATIVLISTPIIVKAATFNLNLNINTNFKIYDKVIITYTVNNDEEKQIIVPYGSKLEDIDFGFEEGYSVVNWTAEGNIPIFSNLNLNEDIKINGSLSYTALPEITVINLNDFSYTAPNAKAYYITNSNNVPTPGTIEDTFALDQWITATTTDFESRHKNETTYYVYAMDENNEISSSVSSINVVKFTSTNTKGMEIDIAFDNYYYASFAFCPSLKYGISCGGSTTQYVLKGAGLTVSTTVNAGFKNLIFTKNGENINSGDHFTINGTTLIEGSVEPETYTLTINPNGGEYLGSTQNATKTMKFGTNDNATIEVPTRDGYEFAGWFTDPVNGEEVYNSVGRQKLPSNYWQDISGLTGIMNNAAWMYDGDVTVYARWYRPVTLTVNDYNTFSYNSSDAIAYYVSTDYYYTPLEDTSSIQDTFALNTWTSATSTGDLTLEENASYSVWAINEDGIVTLNPASVNVRTIKKNGSLFNVEIRENSENGELVTPDLSSPIQALDGSKLYMSFTNVSSPYSHVWSFTNTFSTVMPSSDVYTITSSFDFYTSDTPWL